MKERPRSWGKALESSDVLRKRNFDLKVQDLQPEDQVLLGNLGVPGNKLTDRCKSQPFIVCKQLPGLPLYKIRPEGKSGPIKMWHGNHLLSQSPSPPQGSTLQTDEEESKDEEEMDFEWPCFSLPTRSETVNPELPKSMSHSETREETDELQIPEAIETETSLTDKPDEIEPSQSSEPKEKRAI